NSSQITNPANSAGNGSVAQNVSGLVAPDSSAPPASVPQSQAQQVPGVPTDPAPPVQPMGSTASTQSQVSPPVDSAEDPNSPRGKAFKELSSVVMEELTKHFRPELINRFDEVVVFEPLTQENMIEICRLQIEATSKL